jgi:hypothetical protein
LITAGEASPPTPPNTPPSSDYRVVKVRQSHRFGSYTTRRTYKATQVAKKRKGQKRQKSSTKRPRVDKRSNEITDTLGADSSTADILGSDIAGASPRTAIHEVENRMNSSDILHRNGRFLESTNRGPATRHDHGPVKEQASAAGALPQTEGPMQIQNPSDDVLALEPVPPGSPRLVQQKE